MYHPPRMLQRSLFLAAILTGACAPDRTAVLIEVSSTDLAVPDDLDGLTFHAVSQYGSTVERSFSITETWPHSLTIVPLERERQGFLRVEVTGTRGGAFVVRRVVETTIEEGTTKRVLVELPGSCRGVVCADGIDCRGGACGGAADAGRPAAGAEAGIVLDAGEDGGIAPDAGDAGEALDAGPLDSGAFDSAVDAGSDSGARDGGIDAPVGFDGGPRPAGALIINEVDYDQPSADTAEYIEIRNVSSASIDLRPYTLYFLDGSSSPAAIYAMQELSGTLEPGQYLVVGAMTVIASVPPTARTQLLSSPIQNGPDGLALWDRAGASLVDSLSYGAAITMATIEGRTVSLVHGMASSARDSSSAVRTVCRSPDSADTGNDSVDWATCGTPTPGGANVP